MNKNSSNSERNLKQKSWIQKGYIESGWDKVKKEFIKWAYGWHMWREKGSKEL